MRNRERQPLGCAIWVIEHSLENRKVKLNSQGNLDIGVGKAGFGELKMKRESTVECGCGNKSLPGGRKQRGEAPLLSAGCLSPDPATCSSEKGPQGAESPEGNCSERSCHYPRSQEDKLKRRRLCLWENLRAVWGVGVVQEVRDWHAELLLSHANTHSKQTGNRSPFSPFLLSSLPGVSSISKTMEAR